MGIAYRTEHYSRLPDPDAIGPEDMAALVMSCSPASDSEALKLLRARYPESPLAARVAALGYLMRRKPVDAHSPK